MPSLQEIKNRMSSVATTKKITKAMQLVATAKLKKVKNNLSSVQEYYTSVYETFQNLLTEIDDFRMIYSINNKAPMLYVVITSDLGLCGSYNSSVLKILASESKHEDKIIMIGTKGSTSFKVRGEPLYRDFSTVGDDPNYWIASQIGKEALALFVTGEVRGIQLMHTKFINSVTFETTKTQILPVEPNNDKTKITAEHAVAELEPDPETVVKNSLPLYVNAVIFGSMVESKVAEMSSRRVAMENATDNADDLISKLDLEYNRVRQATITQEISEIVAGSEE